MHEPVVTRISDRALEHLRRVTDRPDLSNTRYDLVEPLGRGGMGSVYLVHDRDLDRRVALKVLVSESIAPAMCERLVKEAQTLARLEHPGIVPVHDVGMTEDGFPFYTMKLVRGLRLDRHVTTGIALAERLQIVERICDAVAFAHDRGVVHRDLKPANIMIGPFGEVLVMDWGVAHIRGAVGTLREGGDVAGTPGFMSPEQEQGDGCLDERSDVFGLGALLRFLLEGISAPRPLLAICRKATAFDRALRYATAGDLARDIAQFRAGLPVSAYRETPVERAWRLLRRYRVPVALIFAYIGMRLVLLLLTGN
ncbi:MAG: serine/threonine-protein kinase [Gemmatimonadota bacterium]